VFDSRPSRTFQAAFGQRDFRLLPLKRQIAYLRDRTSLPVPEAAGP